MMKKRIWKLALCATCVLGYQGLSAEFVSFPMQIDLELASESFVGNEGPKKHKVQKGETLFGISRKYQVSVTQIQKWNSMDGTGIRIGQTLIVSAPSVQTVVKNEKVVSPKEVKEITKAVERPAKIKQVGGVVNHKVKPGETLFGIAREYDVSVTDIKKFNQLSRVELQAGQVLKIKIEEITDRTPPNPNQGKSLLTMISENKVEEVKEEPVVEEKPKVIELKVLTAESEAEIAPDAKVMDYKDDRSGKNFKRVEEKGMAAGIEDFSTDQTKFYAFHKYLPVGSYIRVDYPAKSQSILVEVKNSLDKNDPNVIRLTAKCQEYLRMAKGGDKVTLRYVIPVGN